jgi:hypothetical protein
MSEFTTDNTEGFTAAQLAAMNNEFHHDLALALEALPDGAEGANDFLLGNIRQHTAEAVLGRWNLTLGARG